MDHCDECGYVYTTPCAQIPDTFGTFAASYAELLAENRDEDLRAHTREGVWSPLEYACHMRDVLRVQRERVQLAQAQDEPTFASMRREERVTEERYNEQSPRQVASEIASAADDLAATLRGLDNEGWSRTGIYSWPETAPRTVEWIGCHTIHECTHHIMDIERLLESG